MRQRSKDRDSGLSAAIERVGSLHRLAERLTEIGVKISPSAVYQWPRVPVARCLDVERVTGVSRYQLRPDVFGDDPNMKKRQRSNQESQQVA